MGHAMLILKKNRMNSKTVKEPNSISAQKRQAEVRI